jgi:Fe-S-cluster containining protein
MARIQYDCSKCLALCCSIYERVHVTDFDLERLATYSGLTTEQALRRFTKIKDGERVLRRRADALLGETCRFLDQKTRRCTIYEGRPEACRAFPPDTNRCVYFDVLQFERKLQGTDEVVVDINLQVFYPEE